MFYMQSYFPRIWQHTWSLAVEEHFYLLFSLVVLLITRKRLIDKKGLMITGLVLLVVSAFLLRFIDSYPHREEGFHSFMGSHLRADGIIMGVLLSYLYNFTSVIKKALKYKWVLLILAVPLIYPGFIHRPGSYFMNTVGLSSVNLGFVLLVTCSLDLGKILQWKYLRWLKFPGAVLAFIGVNSYSIYLWHLNTRKFVNAYFQLDKEWIFVFYVLLSIVVGVVMSYLIEKTSLKLRDRYFTRKAGKELFPSS